MSKFDKLLSFIPLLRDDGFGEGIIERENDGSPEHPIHFPYVSYSECVNDLVHAIYDFQENNEDFGLRKYSDILNEHGIEWGTDSMASADVFNLDDQTVMALLVGAVRTERFCDGALLNFLKSGVILKWLERLQVIVNIEQEG